MVVLAINERDLTELMLYPSMMEGGAGDLWIAGFYFNRRLEFSFVSVDCAQPRSSYG